MNPSKIWRLTMKVNWFTLITSDKKLWSLVDKSFATILYNSWIELIGQNWKNLFGSLVFIISVTKEELIPLGNLPVLKNSWTIIKTSELIRSHTFLYKEKAYPSGPGAFEPSESHATCFTSSIEWGFSSQTELASKIVLKPECPISILMHLGLANKLE